MSDVEAYIAGFPEPTQQRLHALREMVREQCPNAVEGLNYGMVGFKLNGHPLIYFGGFAHHIGVYATPTGHEAFAAEFAGYKQGKGSVQFPLAEPLPVDLIRRVIAHRIATVGEELPKIGAPATRALAAIGVTTISGVAERSEAELLKLHGFGPKAIAILREAGARLRED